MSWHLLLILRYQTETALVEERKQCCLRFAACWLAETFWKSPAATWQRSANITAHTQGSQAKRCPCARWTRVQVFIWMPFRRARSPSHLIQGDFESHGLWIRLLPRLWWGGGILFILYIFSLKRFEKGGFDMFALIMILWTALRCK